MPGMDGFETPRLIRAAHPNSVVLLISAEKAPHLPRRAHSCGAAEFVHKHDFGPALLEGVWRTHGPFQN
jgi:DNA-binding NarL/FixJ family response regulator